MRFLGTFELIVNGRDVVTLSAPKVRQVLMLLALCQGSAVRTERFLFELWEDRPPPSAHTTLQTYIYQLRKLFDRVATMSDVRIRLERTATGYLLRIPPDCVDVHHFESLVAKGRAQLAEGDSLLGAETLGEALALWRATSLADGDVGPVLQAEVVRLEELRRTVAEERIEAELGLGRHHQVVGELLGLVAVHPTHEALQTKLMLALYRSGRRSEALAVYRQARSALAAELGLEPGAELRRLHSRILAADPSLDPPDDPLARFGAVAVLTPSQLPPVVRVVGQDTPLAAIFAALDGHREVGSPVVAVTGAPGSGKSALCLDAAHRIRANYPDGQLWAELTTPDGRPVSPGAVLGDFLRAAGIASTRVPADVDERAAMFRSWVVDRRVLVVLDDVVGMDQLVPLLPGGSGSATLVTCRRRLSDPRISASVAPVPLGRQTARRLLAAVLGEARVIREAESVTELIEICDGLPGALRAAASQLEVRPHWPVARMLRSGDPRSQPSSVEASVHLDLAPIVGRTYRLLAASAQSAFVALATASDRAISAKDVGTLLGVTEGVAEGLLEDLVDVQLIEVHWAQGSVNFSYRVRPLFRMAALALAGEPGGQDHSGAGGDTAPAPAGDAVLVAQGLASGSDPVRPTDRVLRRGYRRLSRTPRVDAAYEWRRRWVTG